MATHKIGNFKFNLSRQGFAYKVGDGEIHRIPFGRQNAEDEYDEGAYDQEYMQDDGYDRPDYDYDDRYDSGYDEYDDYDDGYADEGADPYDDGYDDGYDDEEEGSLPFMQYIEENDWVTLLLLVILPPLGIYLLWRRNAYEKVVRYVITGLSAVWFLFILIWIFSAVFSTGSDTTDQPVMRLTTPTPVATVAPTPAATPAATMNALPQPRFL